MARVQRGQHGDPAHAKADLEWAKANPIGPWKDPRKGSSSREGYKSVRADDRRSTANNELGPTHVLGNTVGSGGYGKSESRTEAFSGGFFAQTEARLAASKDANVGQGKARAQEREWGRP